MKIGLFGGTFNPLHNGHMKIIDFVKKEYKLKKIYLIPCALPPHKACTNLASSKDRFEMVKRAIKSLKGFEACDKEIERTGKSFTIDTINDFKKEYKGQADFYLVMGSDAFLDITTWKNKDEIFDQVKTIIMLRKSKHIKKISCFIHANISKDYRFEDKVFYHDTKQRIIICAVPKIDISSTIIREKIKNNESIKKLVPKSIKEIIKKKELYKWQSPLP